MKSDPKAHLVTAHQRCSMQVERRRALKMTAAATASLSMPAIVRAQVTPKIRIGYWPVASGSPFFASVDKGYFKQAGLEVEAVKFASPQQVAEAMLAGRLSLV